VVSVPAMWISALVERMVKSTVSYQMLQMSNYDNQFNDAYPKPKKFDDDTTRVTAKFINWASDLMSGVQ